MTFSFFSQFKILTYDRIESSNAFALLRLKTKEAQNGDIIRCQFQTAGKGQSENVWYSTEGKNLLLSIICKNIQIKVTQLPAFNMLVSLALHNVVNEFFPSKAKIKWPNDLMVGEQKIAGILIETILSGNEVKHAVIGIGINVNEEIFPIELNNACSFFTLQNKFHDLNSIFNMLLNQIDLKLSKLKNTAMDEIINDYESFLFGMNSKRYFRISQKTVEGIIRGVNNEGQLSVEIDNKIRAFNHKEITFDLTVH